MHDEEFMLVAAVYLLMCLAGIYWPEIKTAGRWLRSLFGIGRCQACGLPPWVGCSVCHRSGK